jgi:hypothetical protein
MATASSSSRAERPDPGRPRRPPRAADRARPGAAGRARPREWAPGRPERRRRRRGAFSRWTTSPLSPDAIADRVRPLARRLVPLLPLLLVPPLAWLGLELWSHRLPVLVPRHRAEALCFALAQPPAFAPPMSVEPSAALVRGRFGPSTPAVLAAQQVMHFSDEMVEYEWRRRVGDYDVSLMWLRLAENGGVRHWLIAAWMEGGDLALCNFRFGGDDPVLTAEQKLWGGQLLHRIMVPEYFDAAHLPVLHLRAPRGAPLPIFGPTTTG